MGIDFNAYVIVASDSDKGDYIFVADLGNSWARHEMFKPYMPMKEVERSGETYKVHITPNELTINQEMLDRMKVYIDQMFQDAEEVWKAMRLIERDEDKQDECSRLTSEYFDKHDWATTVERAYKAWTTALSNPHCTPVVGYG
ncbi:MAG: hypothetical protein CMB76_05195 [Euryarchaeota archaeon]|nr:hypothetical protein [Euryarchaeota archaeon]